jgi:hypothetical protein
LHQIAALHEASTLAVSLLRVAVPGQLCKSPRSCIVYLDKLFRVKVVSDIKFHSFEKIYLANIGYNLAQMEFINWLITFGVGVRLVSGTNYGSAAAA